MECRMRDNDVFCAVSLSGTMLSLTITVQKRLRRQRKPFASGPKHCPCSRSFSPHSVVHAGQKCPHFCRMWRSSTLNERCLELVPQKRTLKQRDLGNRRLRLDSAVQHCLVVVTCHLQVRDGTPPRSNKNLRPSSMRAAQVGTVYSSITLLHFSPWIFRPSSTKCNVGAMSRAPIIITPCVVAVCDAVSRHRQAHRSLKCCATAKSL